MTTILDFLKVFDGAGLVARCYVEDEEDCLWEGFLNDLPWWIAQLKFNYDDSSYDKPIVYCDSMGEKYNNRPGLIIYIKDAE